LLDLIKPDQIHREVKLGYLLLGKSAITTLHEMTNVAITFPRKSIAESYEAAKSFVTQINLDVDDLRVIDENVWGLIVPGDTQTQFLEHASKLGGRINLLSEDEDDTFDIEEGKWIEVGEAVEGARFEMDGTTPHNKQEGKILPGKYFTMGIQESNGSTFVTLARVDNVGELGRKTGPGRYVYAVDSEALKEGITCRKDSGYKGSGYKGTSSMPAASKKATKKSKGSVSIGETPSIAKKLPTQVKKVESARSDFILDMLLENDPGILKERAAEEAKQLRLIESRRALATSKINESECEPTLEELLNMEFNESAKSEKALRQSKTPAANAPPVVEDVVEDVVEPTFEASGSDDSVEDSSVVESNNGDEFDILASLMETVGEVDGQHLKGEGPSDWMGLEDTVDDQVTNIDESVEQNDDTIDDTDDEVDIEEDLHSEEHEEEEEVVDEGIDPAAYADMRDTLEALEVQGLDIDAMSDEQLAEAISNYRSQNAEDGDESEDSFLDEGFEPSEGDVSNIEEMRGDPQGEEDEDPDEEGEEDEEDEEGESSDLKDVLKRKAMEMEAEKQAKARG
jgi:hypothetical protein